MTAVLLGGKPSGESWFRTKPDPERLNIICLPQAGGDCAPFYRWARNIEGDVCLHPVHMPGRGVRLHTPHCDTMECAVSGLMKEMSAFSRYPYVILGSSMGAWIGYELALKIRKKGLPGPIAFIVCAASDPFNISVLPGANAVDAGVLSEAFIRFNPGLAPIFEDEELRGLVLPALKADFQLCHRWQPNPADTLEIPIYAFAGKTDSIVSPSEMERWRHRTTSAFEIHQVDGGHYFINDPPKSLDLLVAQRLQQA